MTIQTARYVRLNTLPTFEKVRNFYWYDTKLSCLISLGNESHQDRDVRGMTHDLHLDHGIGSKKGGDVRYLLSTTGRYPMSTQLRKIENAWRVFTAQKNVVGGLTEKVEEKENYIVLRMSTESVMRKNLTRTAAINYIKNAIQATGGEYTMAVIESTAKATTTITWS